MTDQIEAKREPLFNVPPLTGVLCIIVVILHIFRMIEPFPTEMSIVARYAFVPVEFMQEPMRHLYTLVTYAGLHFGLLHLAVNGFGLLAFGSGIERMLGRMWILVILFCGIVGGVLGHLMLFASSDVPLGGISAGVSALFGALLWLMSRGRNVVTAAIVFIATNVVIGMMGMPDQPGLAIAWQAHIAGFATGLVLAVIATSKGKNHAAE